MSTVSVTEHYAAKASSIEADIVRMHAVSPDVLAALREAHFREDIEEVRLATASLPIGSFALERVAGALDELRRLRTAGPPDGNGRKRP